MSIFRVIGFIMLIIAIRVILPEVYNAGEMLVLNFLGFLNITMGHATDAVNQSASILNSVQ